MGKLIKEVALGRGHSIPVIIDWENHAELKSISARNVDVAIEFTQPETAFDNISVCLQQGIPVISGTTGWSDRYDEIVALCKKQNGTFLSASNFSLGVNIFFRLNEWLARVMQPYKQYSPEIHEVHHLEKLDKPSGTAITLAEGIIENNDDISGWAADVRQDGAISIWSEREKEVPGTHTITYTSETDKIEIKHLAKSREGFALGAVLVAEWIRDKKGVYTMDDFLKII